MLVTIVDNRVFVRLSRRNLHQLDAMLDGQDAGNTCLVRKDKNGVSLVVQVEEDADHYDGRDPRPGSAKSRDEQETARGSDGPASGDVAART